MDHDCSIANRARHASNASGFGGVTRRMFFIELPPADPLFGRPLGGHRALVGDGRISSLRARSSLTPVLLHRLPKEFPCT